MACVVSGCSSHSTKKKYRSRDQRFTFHRFPRDEYFKQLWIKAIGRFDWQPTEHSRICCKHFAAECYVEDRKRKWLRRSAIPTIFDSPPKEKVKDSQIKNKKDLDCENEASQPSTSGGTDKAMAISSLFCEESFLNFSSPDGKNSLLCIEKMGSPVKVEPKMSDNEGMSQFECRTCLRIITKEAGFHELFQPWHSPWNPCKKSIIAQDLNKLTSIVIQESDKHSKVICQGCCVKLYNACQFIVTTKKTDQILKKRNIKDGSDTVSFEGKLWPKPIQVDKNVNSDIFGDKEIKQEVLSDGEDDFDDNDDVETEFRPDMDIKIEPEEIGAPPLKITVNGTIPEEQMGKHRTIVANGCDTFDKVEYLDSTIKEEPLSEDESHLDLSLECMLCSKHFNSVSGLKAHVIAHHSYKSVRRKTASSPPAKNTSSDKFTCGTCRRAFVTRTDLMVHETCHNKWVCYGCSRNFDSFGRLSKHRKYCKAALHKEAAKPKLLEDVIRPLPEISMEKILAHKNEEEPPKETLQCNMCSEKFSDSYYMKIHHEIHHSMEAKDDDAQSNTKELSKESKDLETKALQNMFEQVNEEKSQGKVQVEVNVNIEPNGEENSVGEETGEMSNEMEIESEVLPVVFRHSADASEDNKKETENVNSQEQNIVSEENVAQEQNIESVQFESQATDESQTQIDEDTVIPQEENINTTLTECDVNSADDVTVSVEIVSEDSDKIACEIIKDQTEDSMVLEETVDQSEQGEHEIAQEIVSEENKLLEEVSGLSELNETEEMEIPKQCKESVNDEEIIQEVDVGEVIESIEMTESEGRKGDSKDHEVSDSLPIIDVRGHEEMEIDSEI